MRPIKRYVYTFAELKEFRYDRPDVEDDAYDRAWATITELDYDWWDTITEDLKAIGLELKSFDLSRGSIVWEKTTECWWDVAKRILENHGHESETYQLVQKYIREAVKARQEWYAGVCHNLWDRQDWETHTREAQVLLKDFLNDLDDEYLSLLREAHDYLTSEEAALETAEANGYEFTGEGKLV